MSPQVDAAVISAGVAFAVGFTGLWINQAAASRDRRRRLYGEAVKAALSWHEMLYRVRRRTAETMPVLSDRFHDLQESITYHRAWIGSESRSMERSYNRLVRRVKKKTEPFISEAWQEPFRQPPGNARLGDVHPDVQADAASFLRDVRAHLSLQPWRRIALWWRSLRY